MVAGILPWNLIFIVSKVWKRLADFVDNDMDLSWGYFLRKKNVICISPTTSFINDILTEKVNDSKKNTVILTIGG